MWLIISVILVLWVLYDLIKGEVWSYYKIYRRQEPLKYWLVTLVWAVIAFSSLTWSLYAY